MVPIHCGACAINAKFQPKLFSLCLFAVLSLIIAACGPSAPQATPTRAATVTPRATFLPPVPTQPVYGTTDRPYQVLVVPPPDSSATGTKFAAYLNDRTGLTFKVNTVAAPSDILQDLCGSVPTFAFVDGWTMLAAQQMNCGNTLLRIKRGEATGIKSDLVISPAAALETVAGLRNSSRRRDFCRISSQDAISWILPVIVMRGTVGFDPLVEFRAVKDYPDAQSMLTDVALNNCVSAIESGTLSNYKLPNILKIEDNVKVLATSPELPYGGLIVNTGVPGPVADQVVEAISTHADQLEGLVVADDLVAANADDLAAIIKDFQTNGLDFSTLGR